MRLLNCTAPLSLDQGDIFIMKYMATSAIDSESEDDVPKSRRDYKYE